jgi:hypothetical protein
MLEELFNLIKGNASESVINNPDVPNEHNDAVVAEATNTVASGLQNSVSGGGLNDLLSMFGGTGTNKSSLLSNPAVMAMITQFAGTLMNKFNMNPAQANQVSGNLIPDALSNLIHKTNDPNDSSFSLEKIIASFTGNQTAGAGDLASGDGGIGDILKKFTNAEPGGGGGLMDIIKGLNK